MEIAFLIVGAWLGIGALLATKDYAKAPRPQGWQIGFAYMMVAWPLAFVPWERLGLD